MMEWIAASVRPKQLCRSFGILRSLGCSHIERYMKEGRQGLENFSQPFHGVLNKK